MDTPGEAAAGLQGVPWRLSYRTSALKPDGQPVDILHDFYIPALRRAVRYDRVAGYFRSSSLAAASQGFSAFVGRQGTMRLIVGADLEPQDVRAILAGTEEHLATALNAALAHPEAWPEAVTRGVALLAWMVAHGYLDVRVAFRVHAQTGEPLPVDSREDGYVHMKWAVFADAYGHRLYVSGSLNESRTALILNAENIDVHCDWYGERDRQRVEEAEREFHVLWEDQHPSLRVLTLPEAVRRRLLTLAEGVTHPVEMDGSSAAPLDIPPLQRWSVCASPCCATAHGCQEGGMWAWRPRRLPPGRIRPWWRGGSSTPGPTATCSATKWDSARPLRRGWLSARSIWQDSSSAC